MNSLNELIETAMNNLELKTGVFLIVAQNKPYHKVISYPVINEEPLIVSDNTITFFL